MTICSYSERGVEAIDDPEDISEVVGRDGRLLWVDVTDPSPGDLECLRTEFELHPLAMEDATKHGQRPKLERYPTHGFVVAYSRELAEVDLFVGPDWLVTVREHDDAGGHWPLEGVRNRLQRRPAGSLTVGYLVYAILDELVDGYFTAADQAEDRLEEIEEEIFRDDPAPQSDLHQELYSVRQDLLRFRRAVLPMREVVNALLRRDVEWIDDETLVGLQDVYDHVLRVVDLLDAQRELLGNAVDAHLALIANRQNQVMKKMTSWGAILLGATLVAGIYGMNFEHMPELGWLLGYPFALAIMLAITITGYLYFRNKGWL